MTLIGKSRYSFNRGSDVRVTREQLFEFAWSAPMRTLSAEIGISDVGLAKALRLQGIPLPDRGYWAKLSAGKGAIRPRLAPRQPGQDRLIPVHGELAAYFCDADPEPDNPAGPFATTTVPESLIELRDATLKKLGKVSTKTHGDRFHRALHAILRKDERRREKIATANYPQYERAPVYDVPDLKRRLVIASTLMIALERLGHSSQLWGQPEPSFMTVVGDNDVVVRISRPGEKLDDYRSWGSALPPVYQTALRIELSETLPPELRKVWTDDEAKLESCLAEIAATIVAAGEARYRLSISERLEHLAQMEKWRIEEEHRRAAERRAKRLKALHESADLLRRADDLRAVTAAVLAAVKGGGLIVAPADLDDWIAWTAAEADRIDPVKTGQIGEHLALQSDPAEAIRFATDVNLDEGVEMVEGEQ